LLLYVWHLPLYWFVSRHTTTWSSLTRTLVTLAALAVLAVLLHRFVDEPVRRWTARLGRRQASVVVDR
jgi:peptidoglycan/LPS O-acetylase OafA/YrhL